LPETVLFCSINSSRKRNRLVLLLVGLVVDDVVEAELVDTLGGGDDTEPVTELLLLEELLGPVALLAKVVMEPIWDSGHTYRYLR
jgi:hypothetical protein